MWREVWVRKTLGLVCAQLWNPDNSCKRSWVLWLSLSIESTFVFGLLTSRECVGLVNTYCSSSIPPFVVTKLKIYCTEVSCQWCVNKFRSFLYASLTHLNYLVKKNDWHCKVSHKIALNEISHPDWTITWKSSHK